MYPKITDYDFLWKSGLQGLKTEVEINALENKGYLLK
jgi:hypothetical protein